MFRLSRDSAQAQGGARWYLETVTKRGLFRAYGYYNTPLS
ncbi:MAG: hypothetical protein ACI9KK_002619, partial [Ascidiaceihabitans sp.]